MLTGKEILIYLSLKYEGNWQKIYNAILSKETIKDEELVKNEINKINAKTITLLDKDYPSYLKNIQNPPFVLYYYGNFELMRDYTKNMAVIGSRNCSDYGKSATIKIVKELSKRYVIVSGLAKGIDAIAHETAIKNNGKTIAILGSGIDYCYPSLPLNMQLYNKIKNDYLLLSEYPNDTAPEQNNFPTRNRLISALSKGVVVSEAKNRSGTIITVQFALQQGKDIYCVPSRIDEDSACNSLIKEGACLVETADDID